MTARTDGPPICPTPGHAGGAVLAVAHVTTFPAGGVHQALACSGCARQAVNDALAQGRTIRLDPVLSAYGVCPKCGTSVRLRPASGQIGAHRDGWVKCLGQGDMPRRRTEDVRLPEADT